MQMVRVTIVTIKGSDIVTDINVVRDLATLCVWIVRATKKGYLVQILSMEHVND